MTTCVGGGSKDAAAVSSRPDTDLPRNNHGDGQEGMVETPMQEFAFHHDVFNSYIERACAAAAFMEEAEQAVVLCVALGSTFLSAGNTGRRVC